MEPSFLIVWYVPLWLVGMKAFKNTTYIYTYSMLWACVNNN